MVSGFIQNAKVSSSDLEKGEQVIVELVLVRPGQSMGCAWINLQGGVLDEFGGGVSRGANRHNLVVVAVDDESRHVKLPEVLGEVCLGKRLDAVQLSLKTSLHALKPERIAEALANLGARSVRTEERRRQVLEELRAVGQNAGADIVESFDRQSAGITG